jgi:hypothetical protein
MPDHEGSPEQPAWVYKRDGRLVPFDADQISRSLFAASESLGRPDAFLARELTDSVLHFLDAEAECGSPTTTLVAEHVIKIVRELGYPALAQAYDEFGRQRVRTPGQHEPVPERPAGQDQLFTISPTQVVHVVEGADAPNVVARRLGTMILSDFALRSVFTRDLAAARSEGLLILQGLEAPRELAGCVLTPSLRAGSGLVEAIEETRNIAGQFVIVDGPEYGLTGPDAVPTFLRDLGIGLRATGLRSVMNLNCAVPPSWADELAEGPLFHSSGTISSEKLTAIRDSFSELLPPGVRLDWHLSAEDFAPEEDERLHRLARAAVEGAALAFVFDRPQQQGHLAEGVDRLHPAVLLTVGLNLPCLAELSTPLTSLDQFLQKLGSLTRLAISAAIQKRDYLRRWGRPGVQRGFLLDRARLVVVPVGMHDLVQRSAGLSPKSGPDLGTRIVQGLGQVLREEGQRRRLECSVDSAPEFRLDDHTTYLEAAKVAGLSAWEPRAPLEDQISEVGPWHAAAGAGTAAVLLDPDRLPTPEAAAKLLRTAWEQTKVVRLRFWRQRPDERQTEAVWEKSSSAET